MIILLKWHEIHDNGLSSSSVTAGNLRSVQDPTPRAAPVWEDKPQTPDFNWNFNFPQKKWGFGSGTGLDPLVQPQKSHPNVSQQREDISIHHLYPTAPGNDLRTTGSRLNLHFTSKKREKYIHEGRMGWTIIIWNQVSPSVTHSSPRRWDQQAPQAHPLGFTAGPGWDHRNPLEAEAGWKQWDPTRGECVGHSFWFKWQNAPAGGRGVNSY